MRKLLTILLVLFSFTICAAGDKIVVFAAASATDMFDEIISVYNKRGGNAVGSYASSGTFARQIESGAPAAIFLSANQDWMDYLQSKDLIEKDTRKNWLGNDIVLIAPSSAKVSYQFSSGKKLSPVLGKDKLAIGDYSHVPAGVYAKSALEKLGLWDDIQKNIVQGESVRGVLTLVSRGEAAMGIVFGSDALAARDSVKVLDTLPKNSYGDISYPICILKGKDSPEVRKFYNFLMSEEVAQIIKKHGFVPL